MGSWWMAHLLARDLRPRGFGFRVWDSGFRVSGVRLRVSGFGFRVRMNGGCVDLLARDVLGVDGEPLLDLLHPPSPHTRNL